MKKTLLLVALALAGVGTASLLAVSSASAYTTDQLPGLGYSVVYSTLGGGCHGWQAGYGNAPRTDLGSDCDAGFQQRLDDFVNATCPCAQTTTQTTTAATTTEPAPSTETTTTTVADPVTTTSTEPAPSAPAPADTTSDQIAALNDQIAALSQQIAALTTRVGRLELAGNASQLAFEQSLAGGADVATAAALARATYLNAEYGLGEFA